MENTQLLREELRELGLHEIVDIYAHLPAVALLEHALHRHEGMLAENGALVVETGKFTGRSPKDKYIVEEPGSRDKIWWGAVNHPLTEESFDRLHQRMTTHLRGKDVFVQDLFGGADARYHLPVRVVTEKAWHSLFAHQLLIRPDMISSEYEAGESGFAPYTILVAPECKAMGAEDGTTSETFIVIHPGKRLALIGGTEYAGEIKKTVFTLLNYLLPERGFLPMHCSANVGREKKDAALFFGLSGTGKTTLSADPARDLIGDDEHGWSDDGVFNFEGGCYAKCIRLREESEPQIWNAIKFGTVLENVVMDAETRLLDFDSAKLTENTRAAYPVDFIPGAKIPGVGGHPQSIIFLTADAFGVLPPISRLTTAQALFHFISGYTAKIAGTERGLGDRPEATFSACFGQPFLPLHPTVYARLLGEKLTRQEAKVWLVNTGWSGGPYGTGERIKLAHTRAMIDAALEGQLDSVPYREDETFGLSVPTKVPGVPSDLLTPRETWPDKSAYDRQAQELAQLFIANFDKYKSEATPEVLAAAPKLR